LPDGAVISGVATITNLKPTNVNVSGAITATTFDGSLKSTGTPTLGLGVTINSSGINVSGVLTATTFKGDGSSLTGVGESIAPWHYNPDIGDTKVMLDELSTSGIGITFNKKVLQGSSGTATLKIVNAGVAGTTIQSWGVSSTSYDITAFSLDTNVSDLVLNQTYQIDIPEGFIIDSNETSYAGTAYTFTATGPVSKLWSWGGNEQGRLGADIAHGSNRSSPVQVPGSWGSIAKGSSGVSIYGSGAIKDDGTMWVWGYGAYGALGQNQGVGNNTIDKSSPVQVGTDTTWKRASKSYLGFVATKTDGTMWTWGYNAQGALGVNDRTDRSSPVQIPGTTWTGTKGKVAGGDKYSAAIKTDGTLWLWGYNNHGNLGDNSRVYKSSPVQVPGTTWSSVSLSSHFTGAIKTNGTLWIWGRNNYGQVGDNSRVYKSSPVQVPGTTWSKVDTGGDFIIATKTDGTLWSWGYGIYGALSQNNTTSYSSPVQIPGTTWNNIDGGKYYTTATKTDGTLWSWGYNGHGQVGQNNRTQYSSPIQIPGTEWTSEIYCGTITTFALQEDNTP
jgi:alpha-tubulin suppressor-like RCC1 family protein